MLFVHVHTTATNELAMIVKVIDTTMLWYSYVTTGYEE